MKNISSNPLHLIRKNIDYVIIAVTAMSLIIVYNAFSYSEKSVPVIEMPAKAVDEAPLDRFGFDHNAFFVSERILGKNEFLGDILDQHGIPYAQIVDLEKKAEDVFSVRKLRAGKPYTIVKKDSLSSLQNFIYEPDPFRYVVYDFSDTVDVRIVEREVTRCVETASGSIESSLWLSMTRQDLDIALISRMEDALAWSIDFYHTQKGDQYKLIYERLYIDGEPISVGKLLGAYYKNYDNEYYAIYYESDDYQGFYDLEGRATKKAFLKSPVKYSRISSGYNVNRFHPIKKRRIPHLGTDYAAAYGTPIRSVANGVVTKASYTKGNGKYVKVKHDNVYTTQYLHMQKFAKGIRSGVHVKQGQTIGYVGSTGLATGPHVCFRFWKNGRQVNHRRLNFPPPKPMPQEELPRFFERRDQIVKSLDILPSQSKKSKIETTLIDLDSLISVP